MSEEIRKKIEEYIEEAYVGLNDDERQAPVTVGDLKAETRDDIEFGYQLAQEELNKAFRQGVEQGYREATSKEPHSEPSQDELWEEMFRLDEEEGTQEVKKRYRISRL